MTSKLVFLDGSFVTFRLPNGDLEITSGKAPGTAWAFVDGNGRVSFYDPDKVTTYGLRARLREHRNHFFPGAPKCPL